MPGKPLAEWKHWRGAVDVNKFIRPAGNAVEWEGKLWVGSEVDRGTLEQLLYEEHQAEQAIKSRP